MIRGCDPEYWIEHLTQIIFDIPASLVCSFEQLPYFHYPEENPFTNELYIVRSRSSIRDTLYNCLFIEYIESLHNLRHHRETFSPDTSISSSSSSDSNSSDSWSSDSEASQVFNGSLESAFRQGYVGDFIDV